MLDFVTNVEALYSRGLFQANASRVSDLEEVVSPYRIRLRICTVNGKNIRNIISNRLLPEHNVYAEIYDEMQRYY